MTEKNNTKNKRKRQDWIKLQNEFDLFKLENRAKTLKDFCKSRKININQAQKRIKVKNSVEKAKVYDKEKADAFVEDVKKKASKQGRKKPLALSIKRTC